MINSYGFDVFIGNAAHDNGEVYPTRLDLHTGEATTLAPMPEHVLLGLIRDEVREGKKVLLDRSPGSEDGCFAYPAREYEPFGRSVLKELMRSYREANTVNSNDPFYFLAAVEATEIFRRVAEDRLDELESNDAETKV